MSAPPFAMTALTEYSHHAILHVSGIDTLDLTPIIDIKPYVPRFDCFPDATEGWFKGKEERPKPEGSE